MHHRRKLNHASEHLEGLKAEIYGYLTDRPYGYVIERDDVTGEHVFRVRVLHQPPLHWDLVLGDCLHNLRGAVDQLAFALSDGNALRDADQRRIAFPICTARELFAERKRAIAFMNPGAQKLIEQMQPCSSDYMVKLSPLSWLERLSNIDKHRHPLAAGMVRSHTGVKVSGLKGRFEVLPSKIKYTTGAFEDGAVIARLRVVPLGEPSNVNLDLDTSYDVAFAKEGPGQGAPVVQVLEGIRDYIRDVVFSSLEPLIPAAKATPVSGASVNSTSA